MYIHTLTPKNPAAFFHSLLQCTLKKLEYNNPQRWSQRMQKQSQTLVLVDTIVTSNISISISGCNKKTLVVAGCEI